MRRRSFIKNTGVILASTSSILKSCDTFSKPRRNTNKILNAYYFRAQMYTCVPSQIREDMEYMAKLGTDVVTIAVLEQDLWAAVENINIVIEEAAKLGMKVYAVPSRWGGLVAGSPKVPSLFTIMNEQTWTVNKDGSFAVNSFSGRISSIHHPDTLKFMNETIDEMLNKWPIAGVVFDEPKTFTMDYHPIAIEKYGESYKWENHIDSNVDFYSNICNNIKKNHPEVLTNLFIYSNSPEYPTKRFSEIESLDYYGSDGRPWREEDGGKDEAKGKNLLGKGERHLDEAHNAGKKSLWLLENHNMLDKDVDLMNYRSDELLSKDVDQLIYYYYPRNLETPDYIMKSVSEIVKRFR